MYIYVFKLNEITRAKRVWNGQTKVVCESVGRNGMRMNCADGYKPHKYDSGI